MTTDSIDLAELLEAFKQSLLDDDASQNTTNVYLSDLNHFLSW